MVTGAVCVVRVQETLSRAFLLKVEENIAEKDERVSRSTIVTVVQY